MPEIASPVWDTEGMATVEGLMDEARELAEAAGALTLDWFRAQSLEVEAKSDGTEVTAADRAAEQLIRDELARRHPDDGIVGEEHGTVVGTTGRTWIVDPIDGTRGFVRGVPLFSTLIAVVDDDGPAVGVIHLPAMGHTLIAGRGAGCHVDGHRVTVSGVGRLDEAMITTSGFDAFAEPALVAALRSGAMLRTWGDGYGYFLVATGQADVMIDPICSAWDLAPMPVVIDEAGGRFTALDGRPAFDAGNGVATNGALHDDVLAMMAGA